MRILKLERMERTITLNFKYVLWARGGTGKVERERKE